MAKSPMTLPSIGAQTNPELKIVNQPEVTSPATELEVKHDLEDDGSVEIRIADRKVIVPFLENFIEGYSRTRIDLKLSSSQASTLKAIQLALEAKEERLENGKNVANPADALKWILEAAT